MSESAHHDVYDVIIVGGGLTGCTLALALADGRRRILMLEARKGKNPRFNGELIHPSGVDHLDSLGVLSALHDAGGVDVVGFAVVPGLHVAPITLPYAEIGAPRTAGFAIDHHDLVATLRTHVAARPGVEVRYGERVTALVHDEERVIGVETPSGRILGSLTLAADGRHSKLRSLVEMAERARLISYSAAALLRDCRLPLPAHGHIFIGAPGPILVYPINEKDGVTNARTVIDLPSDMDRGKGAVVRAIAEQYLPHVPEQVRPSFARALADDDIEIAANYAIYTDECTVPGLALVGDACGCSHPLTATGMTIAQNDVRELAAALRDVPLHDRARLDGALAHYQLARYRFVRAREILADALYEVFLGDEDGTRAIREGMLRYWNGSVTCRARSMALLSGHDSRLETFIREYVKVVAMSTSTAVLGRVNDPSLRGRVRSLMGLGQKTVEKLGLVARSVREGYFA